MPIDTNQLYYDLTDREWRPVSTLRRPRTPSTRPRDSQRQRVYNTERDVWVREEPMSLADVEAFIHAVCKRKYVRANFDFHDRWVITPGQGSRRGHASRMASYNRIAFPIFSRQRWYVLHEMAHCMRPFAHLCNARVLVTEPRPHPVDAHLYEAGHGWQFVYTYLALVRNVLGKEAYDYLRDGFKQFNVRSRPPRSAK